VGGPDLLDVEDDIEQRDPLFFLLIRWTFSQPSFSFSSKIVSCMTSLLLLFAPHGGVSGGVETETSGLAEVLTARLDMALSVEIEATIPDGD